MSVQICDFDPSENFDQWDAIHWGEWEEDGDGGRASVGSIDITSREHGLRTAMVSVIVPEIGPAAIETYWFGDGFSLPTALDRHLREEAKIRSTEAWR